MQWSELLQEIRMMRFEEARSGWQERRLTQEEAARLPGILERTLRRYIDRYDKESLAGWRFKFSAISFWLKPALSNIQIWYRSSRVRSV